uniref:Helicase ATP-binding domain-containing protein n=1 Tax=Fagus sylvatica TaxID=28930 RepID=A0A2N9G4R4_FAGSY
MNYEERLKAAARLILAEDSRAGDAPVDVAGFGITATLKPYQVEGVSWLIRRYNLGVNVILGDEPVADGTRQDFASYLFLELFEVVLCPLSVTDGWALEVVKFAPSLEVLRYVGDKEHRHSLRCTMYEHVKEQSSSYKGSLLPFDILLTTYDVALMDQDFLSQIPWQYAVIDEAQRLKNPFSVLYNLLKDRFLMPRRLLMTGTPIQNNLTELWALMNFCMPSVFGTQGSIPFHIQGSWRSFTRMAPLLSLQKKVYMSILRKELPKLLALSSGNHQSLQNIVIQLRKASSHPYLFPGVEPEPFEEGEHLVQASGKLMILDQLLQKLRDSGHRVLLFAQMTHTLDILQDFLELRKYSYERLDGSVRAEERFSAIRSFSGQSVKGCLNSESDQNGAFVFMISTRAGGVGLNLVAADTNLHSLFLPHPSASVVGDFELVLRNLPRSHKSTPPTDGPPTWMIVDAFYELYGITSKLPDCMNSKLKIWWTNQHLVINQSAASKDKTKAPQFASSSLRLPLVAEVSFLGMSQKSINRHKLEGFDDLVIFYEQDWNPQVDKQALQRAHRIGQMNHVLSINLVTRHTVEEVIMRRAERKLQLSQNVVGDYVMNMEGKETAGVETGDLRSIIFGLHMFQPIEISTENLDEMQISDLNAMVEKVLAKRYEKIAGKDDRKFEVNPLDLSSGSDIVMGGSSTSASLDPGLDEASYLSWVEKLKEASQTSSNPIMESGTRREAPEEKHLKHEAARKKAEEKKLSKWEALGYCSLSVKEPISSEDSDMMSDSGSVHFVYGDCTHPSKICPSEPTVIFR